MSIFRRDPEPQSPAPTPSQPAPAAPSRSAPPSKGGTAPTAAAGATHIASGTKVVGQISGNTELVIDGRVEGEIALESRVMVGASGHIKGEVQARSVQVGGRVNGNVRGLERVEVLSSGGLEGDVVSPRVVIAEGAFFKGKVEMTDQKVPAKAANKPNPDGKPAPAQAGGGKPAGGPAPQPQRTNR